LLPVDPIPAPGFRLVSGKQGPKDQTMKYQVQFRNGYVDRSNVYTARQLVWIHDGSPFDVVAVKEADQ